MLQRPSNSHNLEHMIVHLMEVVNLLDVCRVDIPPVAEHFQLARHTHVVILPAGYANRPSCMWYKEENVLDARVISLVAGRILPVSRLHAAVPVVDTIYGICCLYVDGDRLANDGDLPDHHT